MTVLAQFVTAGTVSQHSDCEAPFFHSFLLREPEVTASSSVSKNGCWAVVAAQHSQAEAEAGGSLHSRPASWEEGTPAEELLSDDGGHVCGGVSRLPCGQYHALAGHLE